MNEPVTDHDAVRRAALAARAGRFSLVRGGPVDRLARALGGGLHARRRAATVLALATWLPLAVLAVARSRVTHAPLRESFAVDFAAHARCLVAIPLLIVAERLLDERFAASARGLVDSNLLRPDRGDAFAHLLDRAEHACRSRIATLVPALAAYVWTAAVMLGRGAPAVAPWVERAPGAGITPAGVWQLLVSLPVFQFLVFTWLWRWCVWAWLLWRVARLDLELIATHPDGAAGLRILSSPAGSFGVCVAAIGSVLSAAWTRLVVIEHARPAAFQLPLAVFVIAAVAIALAPLLVFVPRVFEAKTRDMVRYSALVHEYVQYYDARWLGRGAPYSEETFVQIPAETMANVGVAYDRARSTRVLPFDKALVARLAAAALVPMAPLGLAAVPLNEAAARLLRAVV